MEMLVCYLQLVRDQNGLGPAISETVAPGPISFRMGDFSVDVWWGRPGRLPQS